MPGATLALILAPPLVLGLALLAALSVRRWGWVGAAYAWARVAVTVATIGLLLAGLALHAPQVLR